MYWTGDGRGLNDGNIIHYTYDGFCVSDVESSAMVCHYHLHHQYEHSNPYEKMEQNQESWPELGKNLRKNL